VETRTVKALEAARFDPSRGRWVPDQPATRPVCDRLTLVIFNVWFGDFLWQQRLAGLLDVVRACRPDVVALQEVTHRQLQAILATEWVRQDFWVSDIKGRSLEPHGVLTLSRLPIQGLALCDLPSNKHRKLLVAELGLAQSPLVVGNLHLESSARASPLRLAQLDTVLASPQGARNAILMGDFNFDPAQTPEQARLVGHFRDLWEELRPNEAGYTEDTAVNRMRLLHKHKDRTGAFRPYPSWRVRPGLATGVDSAHRHGPHRPGAIGPVSLRPFRPDRRTRLAWEDLSRSAVIGGLAPRVSSNRGSADNRQFRRDRTLRRRGICLGPGGFPPGSHPLFQQMPIRRFVVQVRTSAITFRDEVARLSRTHNLK
jgi:tyrosyl-DNA phosphodiesterase 2